MRKGAILAPFIARLLTEGLRLSVNFFNKDKKPCKESEASIMIVAEYDKDDNCIFSNHFRAK